MKTLVSDITGRKDFPIFNGTNQQIKSWLETEINSLDLNEPHSCSILMDDSDNNIEISGDEDLMILRIEEVKIINLLT